VTLGGDKNYDTRDFVSNLREAAVTPHVAKNQHARRTSAIDERTTRHGGYAISQRKRKRVEEILGWIKTIAGLRKTRHRGKAKVGWMFTFAAAAYNLVRMRNLAQHAESRASNGLTLRMPSCASPSAKNAPAENVPLSPCRSWRRGSSRRAWRVTLWSSTQWSRSIATTCRCTGNQRSWNAKPAWMSAAPPSMAG
jgi:hypothetical protein